MPRQADPTLPSRIAEAAYALWRKDGDQAVTIRDVAKRARTTTPSVYAHFADRAAILLDGRLLTVEKITRETATAPVPSRLEALFLELTQAKAI